MSEPIRITTSSPDETQALGAAFGALLQPGMVIALHGNLAAGKTCFVQGVAEALGAREAVSSPTFTLVNEYHGRVPVYHLDLYRLTRVAELYDLGYEDILSPGDAVCLIEWAERAKGALPADHIRVHFEHAGEDQRTITITSNARIPDEWRSLLEKVAG